jgi:hypothetical protein
MRAEELLAEVEALGIVVSLDHEYLRLRPRSRLTPDLIEDLRAHKAELLGLVELRQWPRESRDAVRRFGVPHARLYPLLRKQVTTPRGRGRLVAVFTDRAIVNLAGGVSVFLPSEVRPPGVANQTEEPFETMH